MNHIIKFLLFSSVPGTLAVILLAVNWSGLYNDVKYEAQTQVQTVYEENRPSLIGDLQDKIAEFSNGSENSGGEDRIVSSYCRHYEGKVVGVTDGDTITVLEGKKTHHTIRFRGIDAPESAQDFGNQSRENLAKMIFDKTVEVETCEKDSYYPDREIGLVMLAQRSANEFQVESGLAHYYKEFSGNLSQDERFRLAEAEDRAKRAGRGLWINPNPTLPKDFRRLTRATAK